MYLPRDIPFLTKAIVPNAVVNSKIRSDYQNAYNSRCCIIKQQLHSGNFSVFLKSRENQSTAIDGVTILIIPRNLRNNRSSGYSLSSLGIIYPDPPKNQITLTCFVVCARVCARAGEYHRSTDVGIWGATIHIARKLCIRLMSLV